MHNAEIMCGRDTNSKWKQNAGYLWSQVSVWSVATNVSQKGPVLCALDCNTKIDSMEALVVSQCWRNPGGLSFLLKLINLKGKLVKKKKKK